MVRPRNLSSSDAPRCSKDVDGFKFTNANGDELFADVEDDTNLAEQELVDEELFRPDGVTSPPASEPILGSTQSQPSTSLLTLDVDIPTILEEQDDDAIHDWPISEEHAAVSYTHLTLPTISSV